MKKILIIITFFTISNLSFPNNQEINLETDGPIVVYKRPGYGSVMSLYIVLKTWNKTYDLYATGNIGDIGSCQITGDTLKLIPQYNYIGSKMSKVDTTEISIGTIPLYFKIKGNKLIDITDYSIYPEFDWFDPNLGTFQRLEWKKTKKRK